MIIKPSDDKQPQIAQLKALLTHPSADAGTKKRIDQEIRNILAGIRGEDESAYEMKVHWGESKKWMIIHDLRIEFGGLVAQIDHLIMNRWLETLVCESKHFSEGIAINEQGEFSAFFGSKPYGVPSPIEQNNKHILILKRFFDSGAVKLPTRLGITLKPDLKSLVLVSKHARITRPKAKINGLDCIIKNDQLFRTIDKAIDDNNNVLLMAKMISNDTLEELAREIAGKHKPIQFNWAAKFGLSAESQSPASGPVTQPTSWPTPQASQPMAVVKSELQTDIQVDQSTVEPKKPKQKLVCHSCGESLTYNVAKFCWFNKPKFGGNIYCMDCQKKL